jgi:NCAIR mutase (PurE)-related protein
MDKENLKVLLGQVRSGEMPIDAALERLKHMPFEQLGFATIDHHRALRSGMAEVIWGKDKTDEEVSEIAFRLLDRSSNVLATRTAASAAKLVMSRYPEAEYFPRSGVLRVWRDRTIHGKGTIAIVSAGTSDLRVAEEARVTAEILGNEITQINDIGVAGIHRLFANLTKLQECRVIVACAGMEATLPTAIGGLVSCPVIGVPTSVGYGAHFNGLASLLSMLNSCASNVTVVNIDNGFGGGYVASLINRL